jgi:hypothetical protein
MVKLSRLETRKIDRSGEPMDTLDTDKGAILWKNDDFELVATEVFPRPNKTYEDSDVLFRRAYMAF